MDQKHIGPPNAIEPEHVIGVTLKSMTLDWLQYHMVRCRLQLVATSEEGGARDLKERAVCNQLQSELNRRTQNDMAGSMYGTIKFIILRNVRSADDYYLTPAKHISEDLDIPKPIVLATLRELVDDGMVTMAACFCEDYGLLNGVGYQRTMAGDTHVNEVML
jgi:hypothetical protein